MFDIALPYPCKTGFHDICTLLERPQPPTILICHHLNCHTTEGKGVKFV